MNLRQNSEHDWDQLWIGADIATMAAGAGSYGTLTQAALATKGERIAWIGPASDASRIAATQHIPVHDVSGSWMTPGLIDCHTHLVYGGNRVAEFEQRLLGASYEQIAAAGGGIQSTVRATRDATSVDLRAAAGARARRLMAEGVTTIEIKSGYGLSLAAEQRLLETARALEHDLPVSVRTTFLGLHALPVEYRDDRRGFVDAVGGPWLEAIATAGLADAVDAFCESIAFTVGETDRFFRAAGRLGLPIHVHAGQLSDVGAARLAAQHRALSADHLEYLGASGIEALALSGTVAVLLPCAYFTLRQDHPPPVAALRAAGVPIAVATDCNPGTSPCTSPLLAMAMACTLFGLTPEEALCGTTCNAARALGLGADRGTLEVGKRADFAFWAIDRPAELCYSLGANPCVGVVHRGQFRSELPCA
ncbi:MAG: imidazolonepropionase [Gammaproteobacteria bacterium]|nr:imidazolonepropionase [Gammaproteobacteria bacterium]